MHRFCSCVGAICLVLILATGVSRADELEELRTKANDSSLSADERINAASLFEHLRQEKSRLAQLPGIAIPPIGIQGILLELLADEDREASIVGTLGYIGHPKEFKALFKEDPSVALRKRALSFLESDSPAIQTAILSCAWIFQPATDAFRESYYGLLSARVWNADPTKSWPGDLGALHAVRNLLDDPGDASLDLLERLVMESADSTLRLKALSKALFGWSNRIKNRHATRIVHAFLQGFRESIEIPVQLQIIRDLDFFWSHFVENASPGTPSPEYELAIGQFLTDLVLRPQTATSIGEQISNTDQLHRLVDRDKVLDRLSLEIPHNVLFVQRLFSSYLARLENMPRKRSSAWKREARYLLHRITQSLDVFMEQNASFLEEDMNRTAVFEFLKMRTRVKRLIRFRYLPGGFCARLLARGQVEGPMFSTGRIN